MRPGMLAAASALGLASGFTTRRAVRVLRHFRERRYPDFVFAAPDVDETRPGIPVFTYHSIGPPGMPDAVSPAAFDRHMRYLAANGYRSLHADELVRCLTREAPIPRRAVVITFDDGRASLWTVAYPILKRYDLRAVCFLVPDCMTENGIRPPLGDPGADPAAALHADMGETPMLTWAEVATMHQDGLIDFQSHSLNHALIFCTPEVDDFSHPSMDTGYHHFRLPVMNWDGTDRLHQPPPPGAPIYRSQPRLSAARRFYDDERLRACCIEYVAQHGGTSFFSREKWRGELLNFVNDHQQEHPTSGRFETQDEQIQAIRHSLQHSKALIETHLPGHIARHLCYPWHRYSILAASLAREAGYVSAFIGINPQKYAPRWNDPYTVQHTLPANEPGDDPYQITRIDARGDLPLSLPGTGRLTYTRRIAQQLLRPPDLLSGARKGDPQ